MLLSRMNMLELRLIRWALLLRSENLMVRAIRGNITKTAEDPEKDSLDVVPLGSYILYLINTSSYLNLPDFTHASSCR